MRRLILFVVLVTAALFVACTAAPSAVQEEATPQSAQAESTAAETAEVESAEAEVGEKVLRIAIPIEPVDLDPQNFSENIAHSIILHVHNNLFAFNRETLEPEPVLAESATVSDDGRVWTIKLKQGIKFHDGTPFTADAVKAVVDKTISDNPPIRASFIGGDQLEYAKVIDDYTVEIATTEPIGPFLNMLAGPAWAINSPAAYEEYGDQATKHPVGTGPYRFVEWKSGEEIVLERNPDYFGEQPYYDRLIWQIVPEDSTRVAMLETGQADVVISVPALEMARLAESDDVIVEPVKLNRILYIAIHNQREFLSDKRVRQALNYAVDKQAIIDGVLQGLGEEAVSPIPRLTWGHTAVGEYPYDPDKARELLAEAGVPEGYPIIMFSPEGRYFNDKAIGEAVARYLEEVGLDVDHQVMEWGTYLSAIRKPLEESEHDLYGPHGWSAGTMDADLALIDVFHSDNWPLAGANRGFYKNPRVDELIVEGRTTVDPEKRKEIYAEAQELIWDDAPWIFLHEMQAVIGYRKGIAGVYMWPTEPLDLTQAKEVQ